MRAVALEARPSTAPNDVVRPDTVDKARKVELLARANDAARGEGTAISSVTASYADADRRILVANSDGLLAEDGRVRTRIVVQCVATGDTGMQTGHEAPGRTMGFELFDEVSPDEVGRTAARRALAGTLLRSLAAALARTFRLFRSLSRYHLVRSFCSSGFGVTVAK